MLNKLKKFWNLKPNKIKSEKSSAKENVSEKIEKMYDLLQEDVVRIELGSDIIEFIEEISAVTSVIRECIKNDTGFIFPIVRYIDNINLQENELKVFLNGNELYSKFLIPIQEETVIEIEETLYDLFLNHLNDIFTSEAVEKYVDCVKKCNCKLAADVIYNLSSVELKYILIDLIKRGKSIKNISYVFEKIAEQLFMGKYSNKSKIMELSEKIFRACSR